MSDCTFPEKKSKAELEKLVKANGGKIHQKYNVELNTICITERGISPDAILEGKKLIIFCSNNGCDFFAEAWFREPDSTVLAS